MKYHKKLLRTDIAKYGWNKILLLAASEFSRSANLINGRETKTCLLRAKELLGVLESAPSLPKKIGSGILPLTKEMVFPSQKNSKRFYKRCMALAAS